MHSMPLLLLVCLVGAVVPPPVHSLDTRVSATTTPESPPSPAITTTTLIDALCFDDVALSRLEAVAARQPAAVHPSTLEAMEVEADGSNTRTLKAGVGAAAAAHAMSWYCAQPTTECTQGDTLAHAMWRQQQCVTWFNGTATLEDLHGTLCLWSAQYLAMSRLIECGSGETTTATARFPILLSDLATTLTMIAANGTACVPSQTQPR